MYKNNFLVSIQKDGRTLREVKGREVYLPFGSEYSLLLRNDDSRRCICSIKIDGVDVLGGNEFIMPAHSTHTIERFMADGNLESGNKFKFVRAEDGRVADPKSPENGLVEIEVWWEKVSLPVIAVPVYKDWYQYTPRPKWGDDGTYTDCASASNDVYYDQSLTSLPRERKTKGGLKYTSDVSCNYLSTSGGRGMSGKMNFSAPVFMPDSSSPQRGATVEGGKSNQKFVEGHFGIKDYPSTILKIWLMGTDREIVTTDKLYCTNCGKKLQFDYKHCPTCGVAVLVE